MQCPDSACLLSTEMQFLNIKKCSIFQISLWVVSYLS
jgi:hypothetical protein